MSSPQQKGRARVLLAFSSLACAVVSTGAWGVGPAHAASSSPHVNAGGVPGMIGVDALYSGTGGGGSYDDFAWWDEQGNMLRPLSVPDADPSGRPLTVMRYEFYPKPTPTTNEDTYDPWTVNVGGVHVERDKTKGESWDIGTATLPQIGDANGGFRADGDIVSSTPVPDGRVGADVFQVRYDYPDVGPALPTTSNGAPMAAFATSTNRGARWTAGVTWPGHYVVFVTDHQTGRSIQAFTDISPGQVPIIDLDAICFGFDTCVYTEGGPGTSGGAFHAISPTRILDSRTGLGITNGPVRPGDGRIDEPDPLKRRDEVANHELQVTGRYGVPAAGVSAVLLNVTASQPTEPSWVSLFPKPARAGNIYDDQSSYGPIPTTSNLNLRPFVDVPNMVLAPVGAGGKIRIFNWSGTTHLIADIAGWVDSSGTMHGGTGFTGVPPERLLDTRTGVGGTGGTFAAGETRTLKVAGVAGVPPTATSVVLNITGANAAGVGWAAAFPSGEGQPNVSNINLVPGRTRANLAVVKIGAQGTIDLLVAETSADVLVDVYGYFSDNGSMVMPVAPARIADTRGSSPLGPLESRFFQVAGLGGVPGDASAVIMNVTAGAPTSDGYLTIWPAGTDRPTASNVNFSLGEDVPNLVMVGLDDGGVEIYNELGTTQVMLDVVGYVR